MTAVATGTVISLGLGCSDECNLVAAPLFRQMSSGKYDECAVLELTSLEAWRAEHRTARKRADRAWRRGYKFRRIERHRRADEIHLINLSMPVRQGRPMSDGYRVRPSSLPLPDYPCPQHRVTPYGVEDRDGVLIAYLTVYRSADLALVSQILGHADHLENEVMYLLMQGVVASEDGGFLVYNRWDSGTDGLRFYKERCGFQPVEVAWVP